MSKVERKMLEASAQHSIVSSPCQGANVHSAHRMQGIPVHISPNHTDLQKTIISYRIFSCDDMTRSVLKAKSHRPCFYICLRMALPAVGTGSICRVVWSTYRLEMPTSHIRLWYAVHIHSKQQLTGHPWSVMCIELTSICPVIFCREKDLVYCTCIAQFVHSQVPPASSAGCIPANHHLLSAIQITSADKGSARCLKRGVSALK